MARTVTPFEDPKERARAGVFGMLCFIASLAMVFAASMFGVIVVRLQDPEPWPPDGDGGLPWALSLSTLTLLISSATMVLASRSASRGDSDGLARWMNWTFGLSLAFLVGQTVAWWDLLSRDIHLDSNLWAWTFYVLTALHALHVLGGVIPMGVVARNAQRGYYSLENHRGVTYVSLYWHFLDLAWLGLYATIFWATWFRAGV